VLEVQVFWAAVGPPSPGEEAQVLGLLDAEEQARARRKADPADRWLFQVAHALLRVSLSRLAPLPPAAWRFVPDAHGRPCLDPPSLAPDLCFSLSHTPGLAACAVAVGHDVGIDVEGIHRPSLDDDDVAALCFTPAELAPLQGLPLAQRREARLELFTLKEAYVKARGLGLALDLRSFTVARRPPALLQGPLDERSPCALATLRPTPAHTLALAVRGAREVRLVPSQVSFPPASLRSVDEGRGGP